MLIRVICVILVSLRRATADILVRVCPSVTGDGKGIVEVVAEGLRRVDRVLQCAHLVGGTPPDFVAWHLIVQNDGTHVIFV